MNEYIKTIRKSVGHAPIVQCGASIIDVNEHGEMLLQKRRDNGCWGYTVTTDKKAEGGYLFYADIKELSELPEYEIAEVIFFDTLPKNLTYPLIQPHLHSRILEWMTSRRLKFKTT